MIVMADAKGQISGYIADPIPPGLVEQLTARGEVFLNFPPVAYEVENFIPREVEVEREIEVEIPQPDGGVVIETRIEKVTETQMISEMVTHYTLTPCDPMTDYVKDGGIHPRPALPEMPSLVAMYVGEEWEVADLPEGCTVTIDSTRHEITGTTFTLGADLPANYDVLVECWPYLPRHMKVEVNAA